MKTLNLFFYLLLGTISAGFMASCAEDPLTSAPSFQTNEDLLKGKLMEVALSKALTNPDFTKALEEAVLRLETGDTEVLVSKFLSDEYATNQRSSGTNLRSVFVEALGSTMTETELDQFIADNPSHVFAVRGDFSSFMEGTAAAPAYFMPNDFEDATTSIVATSNGLDTTIRLDEVLTTSVVVLQKSERYDENGQNLVIADVSPWNPGNNNTVSTVTCPPVNVLRSFSAEEVNGSILLTYDIASLENPSDQLEITISRLDPGSSNFEVIAVRDQDDENIFFDTDLDEGINVTYIYRLTAEIISFDEDGAELRCVAETPDGNTFLNAQGGATTTFSPVASFVGRNISNDQISYTWSPPANTPINEYRLSVLDNGQYQEVAVIDPSQNQFSQYTYTYPPERRGESIQMQIQYRAAGNTWVGDFYDRTYGSFRNGDEPLRYYGARLNETGLSQLDFRESQLRGGPEVRVVAARATSTDESDLPSLREAIIFTTNCCWAAVLENRQRIANGGRNGFSRGEASFISVCSQSSDFNKFVPTNEIFNDVGATILNTWDTDLTGSAITVLTTETDETDIRVTEATITNENTRDINADFGVKVPVIGDVDIGVETQFKSTAEYTLAYPGDIVLNRFQVFYHDPLVVDLGNEVFGYSVSPARIVTNRFGEQVELPESEDDACSVLEQ